MLLSDVVIELLEGELSSHAIALEGLSNPVNEGKLYRAIDSGLLDIYTRYPLLEKEVHVQLNAWTTEYSLKKEFKDGVWAVPSHILVGPYDEFKDDVIRVEAVADEVGDVYEINASDYDKVVALVNPTTIQVPNPTDSNVLFVTYRAKHPKVETGCELMLPAYLLPALYAYVGARIYSGGVAQEHVAKAAELMAKYEMICLQMDANGMVNKDMQNVNVRPMLHGWI